MHRLTEAYPLIIAPDQVDNGVNDLDTSYLMLADTVMRLGVYSENRTGINTYKYFGTQLDIDLWQGFSMLTTKRVYVRAMFEELCWILNGHTNIKPLLDADVHIWDGWANQNGDLGPVYGQQWRNREDTTIIYNRDPYRFEKIEFCKNNGYKLVAGFKEGCVYTRNIDQIQMVLDRLKTHPDCRRLIVDGWNPAVLPTDDHPTKQAEIGRQALPACHTLFQFGTNPIKGGRCLISELSLLNVYTVDGQTYLSGVAIPYTEDQFHNMTADEIRNVLSEYADHEVPYEREINTHLYMRSNDLFLGNPFNVSSYAALTALVAAVVGMIPNRLIISFGDVHIYENHVEALQKQATNLDRAKMAPKLLTIGVGPTQKADLKNLTTDNFRVLGYDHCGVIEGAVAV